MKSKQQRLIQIKESILASKIERKEIQLEILAEIADFLEIAPRLVSFDVNNPSKTPDVLEIGNGLSLRFDEGSTLHIYDNDTIKAGHPRGERVRAISLGTLSDID
jgi:hypothetical protein